MIASVVIASPCEPRRAHLKELPPGLYVGSCALSAFAARSPAPQAR